MRPQAAPALTPGDFPELAVVIAAGQGTRLRQTSGDDGVIKPITPLLGVPLVVRTLATLRSAGVREAVVVTGYRSAELEEVIRDHPLLEGLRCLPVYNPEWRQKNGVSVLAAREAVAGRTFYLSMADHVYSPELPRLLAASPPAEGELVLAVDRRTDEVMDPDDAMWVKLDARGGIREIGKELRDYDAVDTGVFLSTAALFEALAAERHERGGDCALADGVRRLARAGRARTVDIGASWWQDVDTRQNLLAAERHLRHLEGRPAEPDLREAKSVLA